MPDAPYSFSRNNPAPDALDAHPAWDAGPEITGRKWLEGSVRNPDDWIIRAIHLDPNSARLKDVLMKETRGLGEGSTYRGQDARYSDQRRNLGAWVDGWCGVTGVSNYLFSSWRRPGPYINLSGEPADPADELFAVLAMIHVADAQRAGDGAALSGRNLHVKWLSLEDIILKSDAATLKKWAERSR